MLKSVSVKELSEKRSTILPEGCGYWYFYKGQSLSRYPRLLTQGSNASKYLINVEGAFYKSYKVDASTDIHVKRF